MTTSLLVLTLIALAVCLVGGFIVWMVFWDRSGERAQNLQNRAQKGNRRTPVH